MIEQKTQVWVIISVLLIISLISMVLVDTVRNPYHIYYRDKLAPHLYILVTRYNTLGCVHIDEVQNLVCILIQ
jgi:hypothetical protein